VPIGGFYAPPVVFADVPRTSQLATEEIFGPILVILAYDTVEEAVDISNGCDYGLAGAVWSADGDAALKVAGQLRTGQVDVNGARFNFQAPFGGFGSSGIGRELGPHGIEEFLELRSVQV
jgi:acyl-CoA reductase-like NAD-dependent aldehyde dehydrogenase